MTQQFKILAYTEAGEAYVRIADADRNYVCVRLFDPTLLDDPSRGREVQETKYFLAIAGGQFRVPDVPPEDFTQWKSVREFLLAKAQAVTQQSRKDALRLLRTLPKACIKECLDSLKEEWSFGENSENGLQRRKQTLAAAQVLFDTINEHEEKNELSDIQGELKQLLNDWEVVEPTKMAESIAERLPLDPVYNSDNGETLEPE